MENEIWFVSKVSFAIFVGFITMGWWMFVSVYVPWMWDRDIRNFAFMSRAEYLTVPHKNGRIVFFIGVYGFMAGMYYIFLPAQMDSLALDGVLSLECIFVAFAVFNGITTPYYQHRKFSEVWRHLVKDRESVK